MKTKYLVCALLCIISLEKIKAADLYVRDLGAGGAYSTISEAITAASDGDRIIIRPKTSNVPYLENLTINKSLTFASEINFTKYYVQGNISIVPAINRVVTINNMYAFQSPIATTSVTLSGGRATVNLINCNVDEDINLSSKNVTANVFQSSCRYLSFVHGKIIANSIQTLNLINDATPLATSDIQIIANNINYTGTSYGTMNLSTTSYPLKIYNNDCIVNSVAATISPIRNKPNLIISSIKTGSTNLIQNNRFRQSNTNPEYAGNVIDLGASGSAIMNIANNILITPSTYIFAEHIYAYSSLTVIASNNLFTETIKFDGVDISSGNINGVYTMNLTTGVSSGAIINAGINDDEYQDLDLTRNDIGPLGGSNSWMNYWPSNAGNKPRVMFLNTPRKVYSGTTTIQAEATGISK